jgi:hypothetical protein
MGGVSIALPSDNVTIAASPGMVGLHERFDMNAMGAVGEGGGLHWGGGAVDARTSDFIAIGFAYSGDRYHPAFRAAELPGWTTVDIEPTNVKRYHDLTLTTGVPLIGRRLCLGVSGTWSIYDHDSQGAGASGDLDAGLGLKIIDPLSIAVAAEHLLPGDPTGDRPRTLNGGFGWQDSGPVAAAADVSWTEGANTPWGVAGGLDLKINDGRIRAGGRWDGAAVGPTTWATWGIGIANNEADLGYSMQIPFGQGKQTALSLIHTIGVQFAAPRLDE